MRFLHLGGILAVCGLVWVVPGAEAALHFGRPESTQGFRFGLSAGQMPLFEGEVRETQRAWDEPAEVWETYAFRLEDYTLEELGLETPITVLGGMLEWQGRFITWDLRAGYLNPSGKATARRDYYIGVQRIDYQGERYEYQMIPEGSTFASELRGGIFITRLLFTPLSLVTADEGFILTPWVRVGLQGFGGRYEIDAGEARGITIYESAEYEYVIGGRGRGSAGVAVPEYGFGAEGSFRVGRNRSGPLRLTLRGDTARFDYSGSTSRFGIDARNHKHLDLRWRSHELEARLDIPLRETLGLFVSASYRHAEAEASLEAKERSFEIQMMLMEKYDKDFDLEYSLWQLGVGLVF